MFGAAAFVYGLLATFVLQGATLNQKMKRPNPPILEYVGYVLCGISAGLAVALTGSAFLGVPISFA